MRVTNNFDESILVDMSNIMGSDEHKSLFAPIKKEAQQVEHLQGDSTTVRPLDQGSGNVAVTEAPKPASTPQAPSTSAPVSVDQVKKTLSQVAQTATNPGHKAAAEGVLSGNVAPGAGKTLAPYFKGQTPEALESVFKTIKPATTASVSDVIPVILKLAEDLNTMGFELSETVADKLLQTITIEAKAKVVEKQKKDKEKEEKAKAKSKKDECCDKCGKKCGKDGKCKCGGKCGGKCGSSSKKMY